jgi:hypothetical protein
MSYLKTNDELNNKDIKDTNCRHIWDEMKWKDASPPFYYQVCKICNFVHLIHIEED